MINYNHVMDSTIIGTKNLTIARMTVIASRTKSELIAGTKAMMIENLKQQMNKGIAHFVFIKSDGTLREAWGTTHKDLIKRHINGRGRSREYYGSTAYFDAEKGQWRSFKWENIVAVY